MNNIQWKDLSSTNSRKGGKGDFILIGYTKNRSQAKKSHSYTISISSLLESFRSNQISMLFGTDGKDCYFKFQSPNEGGVTMKRYKGMYSYRCNNKEIVGEILRLCFGIDISHFKPLESTYFKIKLIEVPEQGTHVYKIVDADKQEVYFANNIARGRR